MFRDVNKSACGVEIRQQNNSQVMAMMHPAKYVALTVPGRSLKEAPGVGGRG